MRTQAALLLAFARGADLLILDEPTEGLDPVVTEKVLRLVVSAAADGATIFFSSHQIAEVEQIAERVLMIDRGKLVLDTTLESVKQDFKRIQVVLDDPVKIDIAKIAGVRSVQIEGRVISIVASHNVRGIVATVAEHSDAQIDVLPLTLKDVLLESVGVAA
jgi:ABC-2 type transport system ATP-binding protein